MFKFKTKAEKEKEKRETKERNELYDKKSHMYTNISKMRNGALISAVEELLAIQKLIELLPAGERRTEEIKYYEAQRNILITYMAEYDRLVVEYNKFITEVYDPRPDTEPSPFLITTDSQEAIRFYLRYHVVTQS